MSKRTVDALTERFSGRPPEDPGSKRRPAAKSEPPQKPEKNLDDAATQHEIMHPDPVTVKLSYGDVRLHQPSIEMQRRISGFVNGVVSDVAEDHPKALLDNRLFANRLASKLTINKNLERIVFLLAAKLFDKPGRVDDDMAEEFADEISSKATSDDVAVLYAQLVVLARVNDAAPKQDPPT